MIVDVPWFLASGYVSIDHLDLVDVDSITDKYVLQFYRLLIFVVANLIRPGLVPSQILEVVMEGMFGFLFISL